jgi:hypothetical protein
MRPRSRRICVVGTYASTRNGQRNGNDGSQGAARSSVEDATGWEWRQQCRHPGFEEDGIAEELLTMHIEAQGQREETGFLNNHPRNLIHYSAPIRVRIQQQPGSSAVFVISSAAQGRLSRL